MRFLEIPNRRSHSVVWNKPITRSKTASELRKLARVQAELQAQCGNASGLIEISRLSEPTCPSKHSSEHN